MWYVTQAFEPNRPNPLRVFVCWRIAYMREARRKRTRRKGDALRTVGGRDMKTYFIWTIQMVVGAKTKTRVYLVLIIATA